MAPLDGAAEVLADSGADEWGRRVFPGAAEASASRHLACPTALLPCAPHTGVSALTPAPHFGRPCMEAGCKLLSRNRCSSGLGSHIPAAPLDLGLLKLPSSIQQRFTLYLFFCAPDRGSRVAARGGQTGGGTFLPLWPGGHFFPAWIWSLPLLSVAGQRPAGQRRRCVPRGPAFILSVQLRP